MSIDPGDIAIIGPGKVGTALAILASRAGLRLVAIGARDPAKAREVAKLLSPPPDTGSIRDAARSAKVVLLCVSDDAIADVATQLEALESVRPGTIVAHSSGALGSEVLAPLRRLGCHVGSLHPLATFPSAGRAVESLAGSFCFIEGDEPAVAVLDELARRIGAVPVRLAAQAKPLYHAAAVMACNYQAALVDASLELMKQAGIDTQLALKALGPLVRSTVDNVMSLGPAQALTGPIARGDLSTVAAHLRAMRHLGELAELYRHVGQWTVQLARRKGTIDDQQAGQLQMLLKEPTSIE